MSEKKWTSFRNKEIEAVFTGYSAKMREKLMDLRELIFQTAADHPEVGELEEVLKWGQPSFLTAQTKSGTTLRIDQVDEQHYALFFNCKTTLVETFRTLFPKECAYQGNRAIILKIDQALPLEAMKQCILMGLTYHLNKK